MIALTQQSVKFWGESFAYSTSRFSARAILKEGITSSLPGSLTSTFVCFLIQTRCAFNADRFFCGIELHSITIVWQLLLREKRRSAGFDEQNEYPKQFVIFQTRY
jgi:hypothetical protein